MDGLRAVAILAVLAFHLDPLLLPGGFIGVDVFLVISGYLITLSILKSEASHRFSLKAFFIRRFWRLYPALLATVVDGQNSLELELQQTSYLSVNPC
ncbi:acyltransferase family protein [Paenalcaligenes faecalis]|uniref:acyltransferase family protein n=1 Tax=Paenalcaligenes faecalis TaxID=2980099 RepID=UPI0022B9A35A|nr:acyltransferase [Paenalcaligenes faecalis]